MPVCPAIQLKLRTAPFLKATQDSFSKKLWINKSILFFLLSLLLLQLMITWKCRALSYRPQWLPQPRPDRHGLYDGRSTSSCSSHDAREAARGRWLRLSTSGRGLLAILQPSVVQVNTHFFSITCSVAKYAQRKDFVGVCGQVGSPDLAPARDDFLQIAF